MESALKIRLDVISKFCILQVYFLSTICLILILLGTQYAPSMFKSSSVIVSKFESAYTNYTFIIDKGIPIWNGKLEGVSLKNQFIYLITTPYYEKDLNVTSRIHIKVTEGTNKTITDRTETHSFYCENHFCKNILLLYEPYIESENYYVELMFYDGIEVSAMTFSLGFMNRDYTDFEMYTKYGFLAVSIIVFLYYTWIMCKVQPNEWSFESRITFFLSLSLIVFNDPVFALSIFSPSEVHSIISFFSVCQFWFVLIFVWMLVFAYYGIKNYRTLIGMIQFLLVASALVCLMGIYIPVHLKLRKDPSYNWQSDLTETFREVYIAFIVLVALCAFVLLVLLVKSLPSLITMHHRRRFLCLCNIAVISSILCGILVAPFQPMPKTGGMFFMYTSGLNLYVYLLAYFYSPTRSTIVQYQEIKQLEEIQLTEEDSD